MKRYLNEALLYAVLSLVGGVFYREFTKIHPQYSTIRALNASYTPGQGNAFRCSNSFFNCVVLFIYSAPLLLMGPS